MAESLHSIIENVLFDHDGTLMADEIAKIINDQKLYERRDGNPVPKEQILARVRKHPEKFSCTGEVIKLANTDDINHYWKSIRDFLSEELFENKKFTDNKTARIKIYENFLKGNEIPNRNYLKFNNYISSNLYKINRNKNNYNSFLEIISENLLNDEDFKHQILLNEYADILAELDIFSKFNRINLSSNLIWSFLFAIKRRNSNSKFKIEELDPSYNSRINKLNSLISSKIETEISPENLRFVEELTFLIYTHPLKPKKKLPGEFSFLEDNSFNHNYDRMIVMLPESSLVSSAKPYKEAKELMLRKSGLKSVISLPQYDSSSTKLCLIIFDNLYRNYSNSVYFADFSNKTEYSPSDIANQINTSAVIKNISNQIPLEKIWNKEANLQPKIFVQDPYDFEIDSRKNLYYISDLVKNQLRGSTIKDRKGLYTGGEVKYIRQTDLDLNRIFFQESDKLVGLDYDEVKERKYKTFSGGIVISTIGNNIKSNILPEGKEYLLDPGLIWIDTNDSLISPVYFVNEFRQNYVQKQIDFFSHGNTIQRISVKDFLKIKLQIPLRKDQDSILVNNMEYDHIFPNSSIKEETTQENFVKILKHTLKQRIGSISGDLSSLKKFLEKKSEGNLPINSDEVIVPMFPDDSPEIHEDYRLRTVIERMDDALERSHEILNKAEDMLKIKTVHKSEFNIEEVLKQVVANNLDLNILLKGKNIPIVADPNLIEIMIDNIIDNARKHGKLLEKGKDGKILISYKKNNKNLELEIQNNGIALSKELKLEDFLSNGNSLGESGGSGFGGFLIANVLKKHNGKIEIMDMNKLSEFTTGFKIIIPLE